IRRCNLMARIAGVDLPRNKRVVVALTYIYGIGEPTAKKICKDAGISEDIRTNDLTPEDQEKLRSEVDKYSVEGDLHREVSLNIKLLVNIGVYCCICYSRCLRVRYQNINNNICTCKSYKRI